jgi:hypothetical protein
MVILFKWLKGLITHPFNIIKGNWFRIKDENHALYKTRYKQCKTCFELEDTPIGKVCGLCGCPLKSKLRVKEETCELHRWN